MRDVDELSWFKSSYSSGGSGDCVEVAIAGTARGHAGNIHVRDSKDPLGPRLSVTSGAWARFLVRASIEG